MSIAVLIPTLGRPSHLQPLVDNLAEVMEYDYEVYFIAEPGDEETFSALEALKGPHWTAIVEECGSCASALNVGYRVSREDHVFTGNDDLVFHVGWDIEAMRVGKPIVGTNDGHGRMTCFALCRRSYIEEHSGVFDQPKTLVHPYTSQYPDTELAEYAKHRGVWGEAPKAITEHMHHDFGKADPNHPNYVKARQTVAADHAIFEERRQQWMQY